ATEPARLVAAIYRRELARLGDTIKRNSHAVSQGELDIAEYQASKYAAEEQAEQARLKQVQATDPLLEVKLARGKVRLAEIRVALAQQSAPGADAEEAGDRLPRLRVEEAEVVLKLAKIQLQQAEQAFASNRTEIDVQRVRTDAARHRTTLARKQL